PSLGSSVRSFDCSSASTQTAFSAEEQGSHRLLWATSTAQSGLRNIKGSNAWSADDLVCRNGRVWFSKASIRAPTEIGQLKSDKVDVVTGQAKELRFVDVTHMNDAVLSQIDMQPLESFTFKGANND